MSKAGPRESEGLRLSSSGCAPYEGWCALLRLSSWAVCQNPMQGKLMQVSHEMRRASIRHSS